MAILISITEVLCLASMPETPLVQDRMHLEGIVRLLLLQYVCFHYSAFRDSILLLV